MIRETNIDVQVWNTKLISERQLYKREPEKDWQLYLKKKLRSMQCIKPSTKPPQSDSSPLRVCTSDLQTNERLQKSHVQKISFERLATSAIFVVYLGDTATSTLFQNPEMTLILRLSCCTFKASQSLKSSVPGDSGKFSKAPNHSCSKMNRKQRPSATENLLYTCTVLVNESFQMQKLRNIDVEIVMLTQKRKRSSRCMQGHPPFSLVIWLHPCEKEK